MSKDLESRLRAALRPVGPRQEFSQELVAQLAIRSNTRRITPWGLSSRSAWWFSAGLAASLLLVAGVQYQLQQERTRANGLEARRQVVVALRMTSQKLNLAYETVKSESL
jgi:hypothetical protein